MAQSGPHSLMAPGLVEALLDWVLLQPARTMAKHRAARVMIDLMGDFSLVAQLLYPARVRHRFEVEDQKIRLAVAIAIRDHAGRASTKPAARPGYFS